MKRTKLWCIHHHHRHGDDIFHVLCRESPDIDKVFEKIGTDYEPGRDFEEVTITEVTIPGAMLPDVPAGKFVVCS